jgi:hypothetical protein
MPLIVIRKWFSKREAVGTSSPLSGGRLAGSQQRQHRSWRRCPSKTSECADPVA